MNRKCVPKDQIKNLSYGEHPDGHKNPAEEQGTLSEYKSRFCKFKLKDAEQTDMSKREWKRIMELMENLETIQRRSYTNPFDSHYPIIRTGTVELPKDDKAVVKEAMLKYFKMNSLSEYQAIYNHED